MFLRPSEIYFTQNSITNTFGRHTGHKGISIGRTLDDLVNGVCSIRNIPRISVIKENGKWLTADNRRLWIFRYLEKLGKCSEIPVYIVSTIDERKRTSTNGGRDVSIYRGRDPGGNSWRKVSSILIPEFVANTEKEICVNPNYVMAKESPPTCLVGKSANVEELSTKKETSMSELWSIKSAMKSRNYLHIQDNTGIFCQSRLNIISKDVIHTENTSTEGTLNKYLINRRQKFINEIYARRINDLSSKSFISTSYSVLHGVRRTTFKPLKSIVKRMVSSRKRMLSFMKDSVLNKCVTFCGSDSYVYGQEMLSLLSKKIHYKRYKRFNDDEYTFDVYLEYFQNDCSMFAIDPSEYIDCPEDFDPPELDEWLDHESYTHKISNFMQRHWGQKDISNSGEYSNSDENKDKFIEKNSDVSKNELKFNEKDTDSSNYDSDETDSDFADESDTNGFMYYELTKNSESIDTDNDEQYRYGYPDSDYERVVSDDSDVSETGLDKTENKRWSGIMDRIKYQNKTEIDDGVLKLTEYEYSSDSFTDSEYDDNNHTSFLDKIYHEGLYDSSDSENAVFDYFE